MGGEPKGQDRDRRGGREHHVRKKRIYFFLISCFPFSRPDAFHAALGSLYQDEMTVEPSAAVPILAAGTLLQLEGLIEQSTQLMRETVNAQTVLKYLDAAER